MTNTPRQKNRPSVFVVVANGEYVGSGQYIPKSAKAKKTIRYDYFETPIVIDGQGYIVTFDVEVFANTNNYRTHKVINEMDLIPVCPEETGTHQPQDTVRADIGTHQPQGTGEQGPSVSISIYNLLQKVKSTAEEMVERPEELPESILKQFRPLWEKQLTAAKCKVLGDFLGFAPEFQKTIEPLLTKTLADAEDIARWESLNLPPETWQHLQPMYQEKKASIQWLEDYLAKLEERNGGEQRGGIITFPE